MIELSFDNLPNSSALTWVDRYFELTTVLLQSTRAKEHVDLSVEEEA